MTNEKIDIAQNIIKPPVGDREREEDLLATLEAIPEENIMKMGAKMDEAERKREEEEKKEEILQELKDFRERWDKRIKGIDKAVKNTIIEKSKDIPVSVGIDDDGSRLIEFSIGGEARKILDPKLRKYSESFKPNWYKGYEDSINRIYDYNYVKLNGMRGDVDNRANTTLRDYVIKKKDNEGFDIATEGQIKNILLAIGKKAKLDKEEDQIAMFMYLTGIDGWYWLKDYSGYLRSILVCRDSNRGFDYDSSDYNYASLCLIACEK